jgi:hypothetical protein
MFPLILSLLPIFSTVQLGAQENSRWFENGPWRLPAPKPQAKILPLISVRGSGFVSHEGDHLGVLGLRSRMGAPDAEIVERL